LRVITEYQPRLETLRAAAAKNKPQRSSAHSATPSR
jgi:hypothetical protein